MITQTTALLVDAYRELNAKRLFWIVLFLSSLIVGAMACIGINEKGLTILHWSFDNALFNSNVVSKATFYKTFVFIPFGFNVWLAWAATILALISTASIIPDFISSGSIELSLSRPIGRLRLFLTKYVTGLLFVTLQVAVFSVGAFLVIGIRGETWEPRLFMSIPLVVMMFSYLFAVCALIGMITRSTITSLLITGVFWLLIFLVHFAESGILLSEKEQAHARIEKLERVIQVELPKRIADQEAKAVEPPAPTLTGDSPEAQKEQAEYERAKRLASGAKERAERYKQQLVDRTNTLKDSRESVAKLESWHGLLFGVKTVLPKTSETLGLLQREITSMSDVQGFNEQLQAERDIRINEEDRELNIRADDVSERMDKELRSRSVWWIIGTSLAFEAAVLGLASWIFVRRDF